MHAFGRAQAPPSLCYSPALCLRARMYSTSRSPATSLIHVHSFGRQQDALPLLAAAATAVTEGAATVVTQIASMQARRGREGGRDGVYKRISMRVSAAASAFARIGARATVRAVGTMSSLHVHTDTHAHEVVGVI